jgi:Transposase DDE domain group 1
MAQPYRSAFGSFLTESRRSRSGHWLGGSVLLRYNDRPSERERCGGAVGRGGRPCPSKSIRKAIPCVRRGTKAASSDRSVPDGRKRSGPFASDFRSSTTIAIWPCSTSPSTASFGAAISSAFGSMTSPSADTQFAEATCGTIRLKHLKLAGLVRISARRIKFALASACPYADEWRLAAARLGSLA